MQKDGACIGYVSIAHHIIREDVMATTIYYGVAHQYRNRGLGSQIVKEISDYLLTRKDINMVIMNINVQNIYSQKAATKAGFTYIPEFSDDEELQFIKK